MKATEALTFACSLSRETEASYHGMGIADAMCDSVESFRHRVRTIENGFERERRRREKIRCVTG